MQYHSRRYGKGPRQVLAIHCTLAHSGAWRGLADAMGAGLTINAYDMPSHGKSPDWDGTGDLHDLVTAWGHDMLSEPMDVIGHSFGAIVALRLAAEAPERVRSLTLIEPVAFAFVAADDPAKVEEYRLRNLDFDAAMQAGDKMQAARSFNRGWGNGVPWDEIPEQTRQYMADRIDFVAGSAPAVQRDSIGLLKPGALDVIKCPVLLIEGDQSDGTIAAANSAIQRRIPQAERVVLEGAGHMAPITHPEKVAAEIRRFLDAV